MKKKIGMLKTIIMVFFVFFAIACTSNAPMKEKTPKADIAVMVAEGFHDGEAYMPIGYLFNHDYHITVIGPSVGTVKAYNSDLTINIEKAVSEVSVDDFDALILPGGHGPAVLREDSNVIEFVKDFWDSGKIVAAICHGPQVLITAEVLDGKTLTSVGSIREEIEGAGAKFLDQSVVVDGNLVTSRGPKDLHDFLTNIVEALKK